MTAPTVAGQVDAAGGAAVLVPEGTPLGRGVAWPLHRQPPLCARRLVLHRPIVLAAILAFVGGLALAAALDGGSTLLSIDRPVAEWIAGERTTWLTHLFDAASRPGDNVVVFGVAALLAAVTWRRCRYLALALVAAAAVRPGFEFVLKALVARTRPDIEPLGHFRGPSHPSGHPMAAASLWGLVPAVVALHSRSRALWWTAAGLSSAVIVGVAAARVYKGAHFLTDVVGSLAWAGLYLACVQGAFDRLHHTRECRPSPQADRTPLPQG